MVQRGEDLDCFLAFVKKNKKCSNKKFRKKCEVSLVPAPLLISIHSHGESCQVQPKQRRIHLIFSSISNASVYHNIRGPLYLFPAQHKCYLCMVSNLNPRLSMTLLRVIQILCERASTVSLSVCFGMQLHGNTFVI